MMTPTATIMKEIIDEYKLCVCDSRYEIEQWGWRYWRMLEDTPYTQGEYDLAGWNSHKDNVKGKQAFRHYAEEEEDQYKQECGNSCGCVLTINTPIMCCNNGEKELTLCNECYWDAGYWKDDQNEDNKDEIDEFKRYEEEEEKEKEYPICEECKVEECIDCDDRLCYSCTHKNCLAGECYCCEDYTYT